MRKLISDENFNGDILRGLYRHRSELDVVRVQDVGLSAASDQEIMAWASTEGRILLTHDRETMPAYAYERVIAGDTMSGVFLVSDLMPLGLATEEIFLADECMAQAECENLVRFFPL